jgi:hypothetical protein
MSVIIKYASICFSLLIVVIIAIVFFVNREDSKFGIKQEQKAQQQQDSLSGQYKMFFNFDGDKSQLIDLIKGKAEFNIAYSGNSKFTARVMSADGTFLATLANVYGPYNQRQVIDVPETGVYLLDVTTVGEWSLSRK